MYISIKNLMRRKIEDQKIRKIYKHGYSRAVTLPIELMRELGWRDNQKVIAKKHGKGILIVDWVK
jgi:antitoxin component of MazEF toxin-antitoxin module